MNEGLPKLVVKRLRTVPPNTHPDADLLTAFAENALSSGERESVLQHLAACADCREILGLATPEQAVARPALPARKSWLTWPYLRWGAALACVVIVGAAVTLRQRQQTSQTKTSPATVGESIALQQSHESRNEAPSTQQVDQYVIPALDGAKKDNATKRSEMVSRIASSSEGKEKEKELRLQARNYESRDDLSPVQRPAENAPARAKDQSAAGAMAAATPAPASFDDKAELDQRHYLKTPPAPMAPTSEAVIVAGNAVENESASAGKVQEQYSFSRQEKANAATAAPESVEKMTDAGISASLVSTAPSLGARWTLSPEGVLQRSFDSGTTWTPVTVAPNLALRAVSASGNDVWVGGAGGALFHSFDNGEHWTQVRPSVQGKVLTGDIIGVEFKDLLHGQLNTTHEVWATKDGGKTWSRSEK